MRRSSNLNALGGVVAEVHRIRAWMQAQRGLASSSRPNSQSALWAIRSAPGARQALHRSISRITYLAGKDPGQPHGAERRRSPSAACSHGPGAWPLSRRLAEFAAQGAAGALPAQPMRRQRPPKKGRPVWRRIRKAKKFSKSATALSPARRAPGGEAQQRWPTVPVCFWAWGKRTFAHPATDCQK